VRGEKGGREREQHAIIRSEFLHHRMLGRGKKKERVLRGGKPPRGVGIERGGNNRSCGAKSDRVRDAKCRPLSITAGSCRRDGWQLKRQKKTENRDDVEAFREVDLERIDRGKRNVGKIPGGTFQESVG